MQVNERWRKLGWQHPIWDYVRFYVSLGKTPTKQTGWLLQLRTGVFEVHPGTNLLVPDENRKLFLDYLDGRNADFNVAASQLRTKVEALEYCDRLKWEFTMTSTKLQGWTDTPKALVAAVTNVARLLCTEKSVGFVPIPQSRGVWVREEQLHVTARNLDGAIPSLLQPSIIWEIKEYWGGGEGKEGGSKMSDAVYECNLVGRELRDFEDRTGHPRISHVVFLDGKAQWGARASDLKRFIDLFNQGIIDYLFVGREVEKEWSECLAALLEQGVTQP